jgi:ferredoxin-NADP reductase
VSAPRAKPAGVHDAGTFVLQILARRLMGADIVVLDLAAPGREVLPPWQPGAHLEVTVSSHILDNFRPGTEVPVRGPRNSFPLTDTGFTLRRRGAVFWWSARRTSAPRG